MNQSNARINTNKSWEEMIDTLSAFLGFVLISLCKQSDSKRDLIIRNFLARGMVCTKSILKLWSINDEQGAWILHRTLIDRLFHIYYLIKSDSFLKFEEYSFVKHYQAQEKLLHDSSLVEKIPDSFKELHQSRNKRYSELKSKGQLWSRPKAEKVAKDLNMGFLYTLGYDYGSTHVHPMAEDGKNDYDLLITKNHKPLTDHTVVSNSVVVQAMLIQAGLNGTTVQWRKIVYDFISEIMRSVKDGNIEYEKTFFLICKTYPDFHICKKRDSIKEII